jgi:N-acetylglucosaminyldiphosphoundecaprenol N-acetyl-beta-D-mannosaminyltransferase
MATPEHANLRPCVSVMGLPLDCVREAEAIALIVDALERGRGGWAITPNVEQLRQFRLRPQLRPLFEQADLIVADGMPLVWASRLKGTPLPERVAGSELVWSLTAEAALRRRSVYLLGDCDEARVRAVSEIRANYPGAQIAGSYSPPFGFDLDGAEMDRIRARLVAARPDIVYVALGFPKQEQVIARLRAALPRTWFIGVGKSLSFIGGHVRRAPDWMSQLGLEWIHRLAQEPRRLAKRYLLLGIPFGAWLIADSAASRLRRRRPEPVRITALPTDSKVVFVRGAIERRRAAEVAGLLEPPSAPVEDGASPLFDTVA